MNGLRSKLSIWFLLILMVLCHQSVALAARIQSIKLDDTVKPEQISIHLQMQGQYHYRTFTLANPNRVVIDLIDTQKACSVPDFKSNTIIERIRFGKPKPNVLRLVLDVKKSMSIVAVSPNGGSGQTGRLSVTMRPNSVASHAPPPSVPTQKAPNKPLRDVVIVLDPGHGGKDPGAFGARRTAEKKVVLAIAQKLKQKIDKQPGMKAILTRKGDYFVALRDRLDIARKYDADIFVSIHADAFIQPQSRGASVFAISQRGATSEAARWLAEKENYSELGGVNLSELDDQNNVIRTVLIDLSQTATTSASLQMGTQVLNRLNQMTPLHSKKVEQAPFVVLKSPDIPSILIETGFISNPEEEKNLNDPKFQDKLTLAIFEGLKQYFWRYPPHGTHIEAMANQSLKLAELKPGYSSSAQASG